MSQSQATSSIKPANNYVHALERDLTLEPLAKACVAALRTLGKPGSGLKVLRLVSKHAKEEFSKAIRGYTLILNGKPKNLPQVSLLRLTQLSRLRVVVVADTETRSLGPAHFQQVQEFMAVIGPSLHTVTKFTLILPVERTDMFDGSEEETAALLSPVAAACPLVKLLKIRGDVGSPLLAAFGASCSGLTSLKAQDVPPSTLELLSQLLPNLTSTRMSLVGDVYDDDDRPSYSAAAIAACSTLVKLDAGGHGLTAEVWQALPSCLQELIFGENLETDNPEDTDEEQDDVMTAMHLEIPKDLQLPNLRDISYMGTRMPLCLLASLLRIAPNLQRIAMNDVWVPCSTDQIEDMALVHERLCAGLAVSDDPEKPHLVSGVGARGRGIVLVLQDMADTAPGSPAALFVSSLPIFEKFASIKVEAADSSMLLGLARAFPGLKYLRVPESGLQGSSWFPSLAAFFRLQVLEFRWRVAKFAALELGVLCIKIPGLRYLLVETSLTDRESLSVVLKLWGSRVIVQGGGFSYALE